MLERVSLSNLQKGKHLTICLYKKNIFLAWIEV